MQRPRDDAVGRLIDRPRLNELLIGRFDHRLTTVVGVAGSGKTSAVLRAIENNRLDPRGLDVFVALHSSSNDELHLLAQIADALGVGAEPTDTPGELLDLIADRVWSHAPDEVAIILDDAHIVVSPDSLRRISDLLERLPRNGHVMATSRSMLDVPIARLRAGGELASVTDDDLALDDLELARLRASRGGHGIDDLPRHAATADLQLAAGPSAGADFLREEVLSALDEQRLVHLQRLSVFEEFDDEMVLGVTGGEYDAGRLLGRLPLVESRSDGTFRLHALLHEALDENLSDEFLRSSRSSGAELLRARGDYAHAVRLHILAGDHDAACATAREVLLLSGVQQAIPLSTEVRRLIGDLDPGSALLAMYDATLHRDGRGPQLAARLEAAAVRARDSGDDFIETLALFRAVQTYMLDGDVGDTVRRHSDRLAELSDAVPFATVAAAHARSALATAVGDSETAAQVLDLYQHFEGTLPFAMRDHRLCDLARPEEVGQGLTPGDLADLPPGAEVMISFAMWLRGDASPELADLIVSDILAGVFGRGVDHTTLATLAVATTIALTAGSSAEAVRRSQRARDIAGSGVPRAVALFADIAAASVAADTVGDDAAGFLLDPEVCGFGIDAWPQRPQLLALALIYVTRPETRSTLDACDFGPSLRVAVAAGRALVALRDDGDPTLAARLPWSLRNLLRVHVLPHHLTELACAAHLQGIAAADEMLDEIPDVTRHLRRVADSAQPAVAARAVEVLATRPAVAPHTAHLLLLGQPRLVIDGVPVTSQAWTRRVRVRELLCVLAERRQVSRRDVIGLMWPEHDDDRKADGSLRTHLWQLQNVLEPDRPPDVEPYFVTSDGETLSLHADVTTDVDEFDSLLVSARRLDDAGSPALALDEYTTALELVRGEYADGLDAGWATLTQLRIRSQVLSATCRVAELVGARGEPEAALHWAMRARQLDPLSDRAARAFVGALDATGDRSAVREAMAQFEDALGAAGLEPELATTRLFERLRRPMRAATSLDNPLRSVE